MNLQKRVQASSLLGLLCVLAAGCIFSPDKGGSGGTTKKILPRTSPDNCKNNLEATYELRDPTAYDSLLSEGYVFRFAPGDIGNGSPDSLIRGEELTFAQHLFQTGVAGDNPAASRITLNITTVTIADDSRIGHSGWKRYSVNTALRISFPNGNDLQVDSPAELYFKQEPEGSGLWKMAEWRDIVAGAPGTLASLDH